MIQKWQEVRVPIARLAAAQTALKEKIKEDLSKSTV
jgi:hypothetical protein